MGEIDQNSIYYEIAKVRIKLAAPRVILNMFRLAPAYLMIRNNQAVTDDLNVWKALPHISRFEKSKFMLFSMALLDLPEFRNLVNLRLLQDKKIIGSMIFKKLFPLMDTLVLQSLNIGKGLFIQHGFATIISPKKMGDYCWVNQQVTIGFEKDEAPVIGDRVRIGAGAKIIGKVTIGDNAIIGAGAVVTKDVPAGEIWAGNPAHFIKKVEVTA